MASDAPEATTDELEAEVASLRSQLDEAEAKRAVRTRSTLSVVLVVLTAISVIAATVGYWMHDVVFDTDSFMEVVEPSITSDEFTAAMSDRVADEAITALDLRARLEVRLGAIDRYLQEELVDALEPGPAATALLQRLDVPSFSDLAAPISSVVDNQIRESVDRVVQSEDVQAAIVAGIRRSHEAAVTLIRGDLESLENVTVEGGEVRWNLLPAVSRTLQRVIDEGLTGLGLDVEIPRISADEPVGMAIANLAEALEVELPEDFGQITVMSSDKLEDLQTAGRWFDRLMWLLIGLVVVLTVAAIAISPHRRRTVVQLGLGAAVAMLLAGLTIGAIVDQIQEGIADPATRGVVADIVSNVVASLRGVWWIVFGLTILIGLVAWIAGRPRSVEVGRSWVASQPGGSRLDRLVTMHHDLIVIVLIGVALLALWGFGVSLLSGLLVGGSLGLSLWYVAAARGRVEASPDTGEGVDVEAETAEVETIEA